MVCDAAFIRPAEVDQLCADASKARERLGWAPMTGFDELVTMMVESDLKLLSAPGGCAGRLVRLRRLVISRPRCPVSARRVRVPPTGARSRR